MTRPHSYSGSESTCGDLDDEPVTKTGPARFCVTNAKGGTGKTTVAIDVAGALNDRGRDVRISTSTRRARHGSVGLVEAYDADPPTLFEALTGDPSARVS